MKGADSISFMADGGSNLNEDDFDLLESDLFGIQVIKKSSLPHIKKRIGRVIGAYKKVGSKSYFLSHL